MNRKLYPCEICGRQVPMRTHGMCPSCWQKNNPAKKGKPLQRKKAFLAQAPKQDEEKDALDKFFLFHLEILKSYPISMASGERILNPNKCNICHIFPKRYYKSVAANLNNCIYLTWQEHNRFDYLLDCMEFEQIEEEFPKAWEMVKKKYFSLKSKITETEGKLFQRLQELFES